jgi:hypothetical protein
MTRFIALLAIVSGLLLAESKADETEKWCVGNRAQVDKLVSDVQEQNFPVRHLDETNAMIFMSLVRQMGLIENVPHLPGTQMTILMNPGVQIWGIIVKGDKWCARIVLGWSEYMAIVHAMKPKGV